LPAVTALNATDFLQQFSEGSMKVSFSKILRGGAFSIALLVIVGANHTAARADEITVLFK
jgi:hypothetical protein